MTRKDFIKMADMFAELHKETSDASRLATWQQSVKSFCEVAKSDNDRFDEDRFYGYILDKVNDYEDEQRRLRTLEIA